MIPSTASNRLSYVRSVVALFAFSVAGAVCAQPMPAFTYQGELSLGGQRITNSCDLDMSLYDAAAGGTMLVGPYMARAVAIVDGRFTVEIPGWSATVWDGNRWLEIAVACPSGASLVLLAPRTPITAAPSAALARYVGTNGVASSALQSDAVTSAKLGAAAVTTDKIAAAAVGASKVAKGEVQLRVGSACAQGSSISAIGEDGSVACVADKDTTYTAGAGLQLNGTTFSLAINEAWLRTGNAGTTPGTHFLGTTDNQPLEFKVNGERALRIEPATTNAYGYSPNIVGGRSNNIIGNGFVGAVIGGGGSANSPNRVDNHFATVVGGEGNTASGIGSTAMGVRTTASGGDSTAMGRGSNASGFYSTAMSYFTTASGSYSSAMGERTTAGGSYSTAMGYRTTANGDSSTAMGSSSIAFGTASTAMGDSTSAGGNFSTAMGYRAKANHPGTFVWADSQAADFASTAGNQFAVRANGGALLDANVQIGTSNGDYQQLRLGGGNSAGFLYGSFPALGDGVHLAYNHYYYPWGAGVVENSGGATSRVTVGYGVVSLFVGGVNSGPTTERLRANATGVTVFGTFNNSSDRNAKQDFAAVDNVKVLDKVLQLPISEWSYKDDPGTRHLGPMAQDFHAVFNLGTDDKHIAPLDEGGVALAAIQGLNQKVEIVKQKAESLEQTTAQNETEIAKLQQELAEIKRLLVELTRTKN